MLHYIKGDSAHEILYSHPKVHSLHTVCTTICNLVWQKGLPIEQLCGHISPWNFHRRQKSQGWGHLDGVPQTRGEVGANKFSAHMYFIDIPQSLIIIQKHMLRYHNNIIACQGVQPLQILTKHLAGRLAHHLQNWQAITQDRFALTPCRGTIKIDFWSYPRSWSTWRMPFSYSHAQSV